MYKPSKTKHDELNNNDDVRDCIRQFVQQELQAINEKDHQLKKVKYVTVETI